MDSDVKHTPGPWRSRAKNFDGTSCSITNESGQTTIATTHAYDADEQVIANAKLIASAPDLLEALESIMRLEKLITYPENVKLEHVNEAMAVNRAILKAVDAIKKAKGL